MSSELHHYPELTKYELADAITSIPSTLCPASIKSLLTFFNGKYNYLSKSGEIQKNELYHRVDTIRDGIGYARVSSVRKVIAAAKKTGWVHVVEVWAVGSRGNLYQRSNRYYFSAAVSTQFEIFQAQNKLKEAKYERADEDVLAELRDRIIKLRERQREECDAVAAAPMREAQAKGVSAWEEHDGVDVKSNPQTRPSVVLPFKKSKKFPPSPDGVSPSLHKQEATPLHKQEATPLQKKRQTPKFNSPEENSPACNSPTAFEEEDFKNLLSDFSLKTGVAITPSALKRLKDTMDEAGTTVEMVKHNIRFILKDSFAIKTTSRLNRIGHPSTSLSKGIPQQKKAYLESYGFGQLHLQDEIAGKYASNFEAMKALFPSILYSATRNIHASVDHDLKAEFLLSASEETFSLASNNDGQIDAPFRSWLEENRLEAFEALVVQEKRDAEELRKMQEELRNEEDPFSVSSSVDTGAGTLSPEDYLKADSDIAVSALSNSYDEEESHEVVEESATQPFEESPSFEEENQERVCDTRRSADAGAPKPKVKYTREDAMAAVGTSFGCTDRRYDDTTYKVRANGFLRNLGFDLILATQIVEKIDRANRLAEVKSDRTALIIIKDVCPEVFGGNHAAA